jgi:hypothetical protein
LPRKQVAYIRAACWDLLNRHKRLGVLQNNLLECAFGGEAGDEDSSQNRMSLTQSFPGANDPSRVNFSANLRGQLEGKTITILVALPIVFHLGEEDSLL